MKRVLFVCTHNSARSQMAEGLLRHDAGEHFEAFSAGTEPGSLHPPPVIEGGLVILLMSLFTASAREEGREEEDAPGGRRGAAQGRLSEYAARHSCVVPPSRHGQGRIYQSDAASR